MVAVAFFVLACGLAMLMGRRHFFGVIAGIQVIFMGLALLGFEWSRGDESISLYSLAGLVIQLALGLSFVIRFYFVRGRVGMEHMKEMRH